MKHIGGSIGRLNWFAVRSRPPRRQLFSASCIPAHDGDRLRATINAFGWMITAMTFRETDV